MGAVQLVQPCPSLMSMGPCATGGLTLQWKLVLNGSASVWSSRSMILYDVDIGPVGPSMFHTRRSATKSNKYLREELLCGLLWAAQIRFDTRHYKPLNFWSSPSAILFASRVWSHMSCEVEIKYDFTNCCHHMPLEHVAIPCETMLQPQTHTCLSLPVKLCQT